MSDSLSDLIKKRDYTEPPEIRLIKAFVYKAIDTVPKVSAHNDSYVIAVPSASDANALRFKLNELQRELKISKRLIIRIGS